MSDKYFVFQDTGLYRTVNMIKYSQTCIKRSPLGQRKSCLYRQQTS